jgi:signal transduction histidine kinase
LTRVYADRASKGPKGFQRVRVAVIAVLTSLSPWAISAGWRRVLAAGAIAGAGVLLAALLTLGTTWRALERGGAQVRTVIETEHGRSVAQRAEALALDTAHRARTALLDSDVEALRRLAEGIVGRGVAETVRLHDGAGRFAVDEAGSARFVRAPFPDLAQGETRLWREADLVLAAAPACIGDDCVGVAIIGVRDEGATATVTETRYDTVVSRSVGGGVALAFGAAGVAFAAAAGMRRRAASVLERDIEGVARALEDIAAGRETPSPGALDPQLAPLASAIEALAASIARERAINRRVLDAIADGVLVTRPPTQVLHANPAMHALSGRAAGGLADADVPALFGVEAALSAPAMAEALSESRALTLPDGSLRSVSVAARATGGGSADLVVVLARDATDDLRAQAEAAVARAAAEHEKQRADAAEAARDQFLAVMSHELRTPLNGVLGAAEVLEHSPMDDGQRTMLGLVKDSGKALLRTVTDLLDLSRLRSGSVTVDKGTVALGDLVRKLGEDNRRAAAAKGLTIVERCAVDCPFVLGDVEKLMRIGSILVQNAVKFTETGEIRVEVLQTPRGGATTVELRVSDTGPGVSEADRARIFEDLTQADASTRRAHGGLGVGLALARRLADAMGARITVESTPGAGATFIVAFDAEVDHEAEARAAAVARAARSAAPRPAAPAATQGRAVSRGQGGGAEWRAPRRPAAPADGSEEDSAARRRGPARGYHAVRLGDFGSGGEPPREE